MKRVDPISAQSIFLDATADGKSLGNATGFIIMYEGQSYLITNWHVITGQDPDTHLPLNDSVPDEIVISHHAKGKLGFWEKRVEPLENSDGSPRWIEHPRGSLVDVVALPLQFVDDKIQLYPFDLSLAEEDIVVEPGMPISIIGYPFGLQSAGGWPIWKTGHIATDPDLDFSRDQPAFLRCNYSTRDVRISCHSANVGRIQYN
jgi:hypothetical protein